MKKALSTGLCFLCGLSLWGEIRLEILKTDFGTHSLQVLDLDGDGHVDVVLANRERGSIDIFSKSSRKMQDQRQDLDINTIADDSNLVRRSLALEVDIYALNVIDLNGDGLADLLYHGAPEGLICRLQEKDGSFTRRQQLALTLGSESPASLISRPTAGGTEVVVQHAKFRSHLLLKVNSAGGIDIGENQALTIPRSEQDLFSYMHWGKWKDGSDGLWVHINNESYPISFYKALGAMRLDFPVRWHLPQTRFLLPGYFYTRDHLDFLQARTQKGQLFLVEPAPRLVASAEEFSSRIVPYSHSSSERFTTAFQDVNGDNNEEILVAHRDSALMEVMEWSHGQLLPGKMFPALKDVQFMAPSKDGGVLSYSSKEGLAGVSTYKSGILSFPNLIASPAKTVAYIKSDLQGESLPLTVAEGLCSANVQGQLRSTKLAEPWPEDGLALSLTGGKVPELILSIPYRGVVILTWNESAQSYSDLAPNIPFFQKNGFEDFKLEQLAYVKNELGYWDLSISQGSLIRRYRFGEKPIIVEQVNLPRAGSQSSTHLYANMIAGGELELISMDRERGELDMFEKAEGLWQWRKSHQLLMKSPLGLGKLCHREGTELIVQGRGESEWVKYGRQSASIEPSTRSLAYEEADWQLNASAEALPVESGLDCAAFFDIKKNYMEVFAHHQGQLQRKALFPLLEVRQYGADKELVGHVRDIKSARMTKDENPSFFLLVDNRILIYRRP